MRAMLGAGTSGGSAGPSADDYPGWEARFAEGQWTAWCPAVTVHATAAAELRAAINYAICGDDD
jgi:hypothetical protein